MKQRMIQLAGWLIVAALVVATYKIAQWSLLGVLGFFAAILLLIVIAANDTSEGKTRASARSTEADD